ncbi:MAG: 50S ribosomal protein L11 methyltransferase [Gammaproteobacteria bacterium]|nr:50S ribosomal protein L11 methyltransferase [Gammaproteobacteria bacterium]
MPWMRVSASATAELADDIAARLTTAGAIAVTLVPGRDSADDVLEPAPDATPMWDTVQVEGLFGVEADLSPLAGIDIDVDFLADRDWSETWRDGIGPLRFAKLLVVPRTSTFQSRPDDVVVRLDPGLAFGTGTHATTALCLEQLARTPLDGKRVLDVGSGSGILAIAAARLGATAVAVDHDPQARRATLENSRANGVEIAFESRLDAVDSAFDVVIANLVAGTIRGLVDAFSDRLVPGGELVLSGILAEQVEWVVDAFSKQEFRFEVPRRRDGWAMLRGFRCPNPSR